MMITSLASCRLLLRGNIWGNCYQICDKLKVQFNETFYDFTLATPFNQLDSWWYNCILALFHVT